ncbi:MAG TPA: trypsin-like serine protease [Candidatus Saccharimonadales bacterium]|nr:trypsin-like serine protease [Candidatus Saccharimonadales bacterium]
MRRLKFALVAGLLGVMAAAAPAAAITNTYTKDFEHEFVGLIVFYNADGEFDHRCSGSLLTPTVFLTAGHCTDDEAGGVMSSARVYFTQDAGAHYDPATEQDPVSGYPDFCAAGTLGVTCATSDEMYDYGFDNFAGFPNTRDVGLVILDQPIEIDEYASLAHAGTLDGIKKNSVFFTVSGYGISHLAKSGATISFRERLQAVSTLVNLHSPYNDGFNIQAQGNGGKRGGTCSGDSGGPILLNDTNIIVGVTSFGKSNAGCRGTDYYYRTDREPVIDFILANAGDAGDDIVID